MFTTSLRGCVAVAVLAAAALSADGAEPAPLSGEAARNSEPGRAIVALVTAARKPDRAGVRSLLLPETAKELDGPGAVPFLKHLAEMADPEISEITVDIVDADLARGSVTRREGSLSETTRMTIKRVAGAWKIGL